MQFGLLGLCQWFGYSCGELLWAQESAPRMPHPPLNMCSWYSLISAQGNNVTPHVPNPVPPGGKVSLPKLDLDAVHHPGPPVWQSRKCGLVEGGWQIKARSVGTPKDNIAEERLA